MKRYEDVESSDGDALDCVTSFIKSHLQALLLLLRDYHPSLEENHQHDAHEALTLILNILSEISDIVLPVRTVSHVENSCKKVCRGKRRRRCIFTNPRKRKKKAVESSYCLPTNDQQVCEMKGKPQCNFVRDLFEGRSSNSTVCLECEDIKCSEEEFWDLSVPVLANSKDDSEDEEDESGDARSKCFLSDTLKKESLLRGVNKYYCEKCHHYVEARCGLVLYSTPPVLILQLGRFDCQTSFREQAGMSKLNNHCPVPLRLPSFHNENHCYCLFAVVIHKGLSVNSGHYVTVVSSSSYTKLDEMVSRTKQTSSRSHGTCCGLDSANLKSWFFCDDDKVQVISEEEMEMHLSAVSPLGPTATPYLLFYQKLDHQYQ
ncbi:ubiquitin carboxyl-terminal hydrolase 1-like [Limulus polyphemus]|uniref:Ubiquitin carboxyl-terminal hydrolase 1-like n=1 Tax=Limulus polyphemus TaxID=6850 RepID=A0ABM1C0N4_LIMPO|nr:ubiquitin carboxyl-terminal hydrolase 1-like [Limulus polyphemus]